MSVQNNDQPIALITGGSAGLGLTLAEFLTAQGYDVIITGRDSDRLEAARDHLAANGGRVRVLAGDISDAAHRRALTAIVDEACRLDLLINNASTLGSLPMPALADYPLAGLRQAFEINTIAPLALVQDLRSWLADSQGLVINLTSDAAVGGYPGWGGYGASKAALDLMTLTLAAELADEGISVVSVDPGDMRTQMHQDAFPGEDISDRPLPDVTLPFWAWLLGQAPATINGQRFQAQSELWTVAA